MIFNRDRGCISSKNLGKMHGSLEINWNKSPSSKIQFFCDFGQGWGLHWCSTRGKSMLGKLEINWNKFPGSKLQLVL